MFVFSGGSLCCSGSCKQEMHMPVQDDVRANELIELFRLATRGLPGAPDPGGRPEGGHAPDTRRTGMLFRLSPAFSADGAQKS